MLSKGDDCVAQFESLVSFFLICQKMYAPLQLCYCSWASLAMLDKISKYGKVLRGPPHIKTPMKTDDICLFLYVATYYIVRRDIVA